MTPSEIVASIFGQFEDFLRNVGKMDIFETLVYNYRLKPTICSSSLQFTDLFTQLLEKLIELKNSLVTWNSIEQFSLSVSDSFEKLDESVLVSPEQDIADVVLNSFGSSFEPNAVVASADYVSLDVMASVDTVDLNSSSNYVPPAQKEITKRISTREKTSPQKEKEENKIKRSFLCQVCGKKYATTQSLNAHLNDHTHLKKFPCKYCSKVFTRKDKMIFHESIHTGIKSFICEICGKSFSRKTKLDEHLRRHSGLKKYRCDRCTKAYASHRDLRNHLAKHDVVAASLTQLESAGSEPHRTATAEDEILTNEVTEILNQWTEIDFPSERAPENVLDKGIEDLGF